MKTLDEVITIMDGIDQTCTCCAYQHDCDETECVEKTALHYLKVLQKMQKAQPVMKGEWDELYNQPLTWQELRTMVGKPVWIEEHWAPMEDEAGVTEDEGDIDAYWAILTYSDEKKISVVNGSVDQWLHKNLWNNHNVSHSWTAYRKERE